MYLYIDTDMLFISLQAVAIGMPTTHWTAQSYIITNLEQQDNVVSLFHHSPLHMDTSPSTTVPAAANIPTRPLPIVNITNNAKQRATIFLAEVLAADPKKLAVCDIV